jgi:uncharacterized protein (TIGR00269 family)
MFEFNSTIALGISGGKDSLVMLKLLHELESKKPHAEIIAICIDEGIEGYRKEALSLAKKVCKKYDVEMNVFSFKSLFGETMDIISNKKRELSTCSYCGILRRRAFNEAGKQLNADVIATGHNLDDMAQSVLLNILRGDISKWSSFNPTGSQLTNFIKRVKPLCEIPERETTLYAYLNDIPFQSIPCPYANESMRTDIRNFLNRMEEKRPGTKFITLKTGLKLRENINHNYTINNCTRCGETTPNKLCRVCQILDTLDN